MKDILDYQIVFDYAINPLEIKVKELIINGWSPLGGAINSNVDFGIGNGNELVWCQTMVKYAI